MTFTITPMNSKILVERIKPDEQTEGGVVLPQSVVGEHQRGHSWLAYGTVLGVGPGHDLESGSRRSMDVKEGDIIAWPQDAPTPEIGEGVSKTLMGKSLPHWLLVDMGHVQCTIRMKDDDSDADSDLPGG